MSILRVLVIADDHFARGGLTALLEAEELSVVGSYESTDDVQALVATHRPDVILWDFGWELSTGLRRLALYSEGSESSSSILPEAAPVLALISEPEECVAIRTAGARGLLLRNTSAEKLVHALRAVASALFVSESELDSHLFSPDTAAVEPLVEPLTPRELEILQLIAEGLANKAIARRLGISDHTVKFHTTAIFGKLSVSSRTEAVVRASRAGLILL